MIRAVASATEIETAISTFWIDTNIAKAIDYMLNYKLKLRLMYGLRQ
jgi:hypothetical protein